MDAKIFIRKRRKVGEGEKKPRYRIVGVGGCDLKIYTKHLRKKEVEQIATEAGAVVVYLPEPKDGSGKKV
jgi:hypothetical protein